MKPFVFAASTPLSPVKQSVGGEPKPPSRSLWDIFSEDQGLTKGESKHD